MLKAGQVIAGRYLLASPIGEGSMGAVWRAEDQTLRRQVAIKFLFVKAARDPQAMVDQFLREARIAASVQHRNVIQTVDFGTVNDYQPFMVMELLNGESLGDRFAREPPLTREQIVHIVSLTLRGLAAVHDAGIVHRDLKPQNVFLQRDSDAVYPKILDFGISRSLEQRAERPSAIATQEGMIVGTPDYMSPEQARGEASIDVRSDLYSIAVILYEGMTGRLPFQAEAIGDLIVKIITQEPPTMREVCPDIPHALSEVVGQAMAKKREHRFSDARAMRRALLAAAEAAPSAGKPATGSVPLAEPSAQRGAGAPPAAARPPGPEQAVSTHAATWGDFEGLKASRILDDSPPPLSGSVQPGAKPQRIVARLGDQISARPRGAPPPAASAPPELLELAVPPGQPALERPSAERERARKQRKPGARAGAAAADALDPLYAGVGQAVPDIDYERVRGAARKPTPEPAPKARARSTSRRTATPVAAPSRLRYYARSLRPWILPLTALLLAGYALGLPPLRSARGALANSGPAASAAESPSASLIGGTADPSLQRLRLQVKGRRANPGQAPAHLRDIVF